jgi:lantibiotic biosynthesis protein
MKPASVVEPTNPKSKSGSPAPASLYAPLGLIMVRAPLLPIESYFDLADGQLQRALLSDPSVRRALVVGSTSLIGAMERFQQSGLTPRDADRMRAKLLRYQIRMSTRPTPFGLFAGVALASWGETTDIRIKSTSALTRTRPDMAWLMNLVFAAEADPEVRKQLKFSVNPLAVVEAGRVTLSERAPTAAGTHGSLVSVRATGVVKRVLALARTPISHDDLSARLCDATPSATTEKVEKLLAELWEQTFLLTDLRPPLTNENPARYVAERLAAIPAASKFTAQLEELLAASARWDSLEAEQGAVAFGSVLAKAGELKDDAPPVQVDMAISVEGRLGRVVATEAVRAAELLLRTTPAPLGLSSLASYREAFLGRYGHEREVPLLEMLDQHRGLGPVSNYGHSHVGLDQARAARRSQALLHLATFALHNRQQVVALDEKLLSRLETWRPNRDTAPLSMDINILVSARSPAAIDNGEFKAVVGPNLGAQAAGRNLGRFADLLAPDGPAALEQVAAAEQAHAPDRLWAELVYMPPHLRSANVVVRPAIRAHEVALGTSAGVPADRTIPLEDLMVGVEQGRFYVRWLPVNKKIVFTSGHMLNQMQAPAVARFLADISYDGKALFSSFDWGPAEGFAFLPRVEAGRVVLRPAEWRLQKGDLETDSDESYQRSLERWRLEWDVPRYVCLSFGDNRLVLDLEQDTQAAELKSELAKLTDGGWLMVQELVPALEDAWLPGPGGRFYSEFVVSLVLAHDGLASTKAEKLHAQPEPLSGEDGVSSAPVLAFDAAPGQISRWHPPGSEWLFAKVYCPRNLEDDVICDSMFALTENAVASGFADSWFFIRYADPEPHIRLRFHGSPETLTHHLFAHVCEWAGRLMSGGLCLKIQFDTYEQELERFGGARGMSSSETIFAADSRSAIAILRHLRAKLWPHDLTTLLAFSIDNLLQGLGLTGKELLAWYSKKATPGGQDVGSDYRKRKNILRSVIGQPEPFLAAYDGGSALASIFEERLRAVSTAAQTLRELATTGHLGQPLDDLTSSFVHLHVNRIGGVDAPSESTILNLLLRTRQSLEKAPFAPLGSQPKVKLSADRPNTSID